ncbi:MAG TPA: zf-HC2 domain-containing protein [Ktedonobacteraceae bacterium]
MRCKEATKQLQLYLDNRLTIDQTRALEAHVANCAACLKELTILEEVIYNLQTFKVIAEPGDLNAQIMRRVAIASSKRNMPASRFSLWRPTLLEILVVVILATIATLGTILQQPSIRALLPIANGHDALSLAFMHSLHVLMTIDSNTLILAFWIVGTILGICITLVLAGSEMRSQLFKAMMERLPVR